MQLTPLFLMQRWEPKDARTDHFCMSANVKRLLQESHVISYRFFVRRVGIVLAIFDSVERMDVGYKVTAPEANGRERARSCANELGRSTSQNKFE